MNNIVKIFIYLVLSLIFILSNCRHISHPPEWEMNYYFGKYDKAEYELIKVIKRFPDVSEYYIWMGKIKYGKSEYKSSIRNYKKAVSLDSTQYEVLKNDLKNSLHKLAEKYYYESTYDSAAFYYREVLKTKNE